METVSHLLEKITDTWNYYFWKSKFCQNQINFTEEIKTNYYGDILSYFNDTLNSLSEIKYETEFKESIFQSIAILQTIYTHQDLIDELLYIFKLEQSSKQEKSPNREIRNELVGHPIRRTAKTQELISSVFFGNDFGNGVIHYVLYAKENEFKGKDVTHRLDEIINSHRIFLEKHLKLIWKRIETVLRQYQTELFDLLSLIDKNIEFSKLLSVTEYRFTSIFKENYLFSREILLECFDRQNEHIRYKNSIILFLNALKEYVSETIKNIDELFLEKNQFSDNNPLKIIINYSKPTEKNIVVSDAYIDYEFSKLLEKHPVYGVRYFKSKFKNEKEIYEELLNMEKHIHNDLEYYSSYEYLSQLLIKKGLIRPRLF